MIQIACYLYSPINNIFFCRLFVYSGFISRGQLLQRLRVRISRTKVSLICLLKTSIPVFASSHPPSRCLLQTLAQTHRGKDWGGCMPCAAPTRSAERKNLQQVDISHLMRQHPLQCRLLAFVVLGQRAWMYACRHNSPCVGACKKEEGCNLGFLRAPYRESSCAEQLLLWSNTNLI